MESYIQNYAIMENVQFQTGERRHTLRRAYIAIGNQFFFRALVIEAPNRIARSRKWRILVRDRMQSELFILRSKNPTICGFIKAAQRLNTEFASFTLFYGCSHERNSIDTDVWSTITNIFVR